LEPFKLPFLQQTRAPRIGLWDRASNQDDAMPRSKEFLLEQIARAQRFPQAINTDADRKRFEKVAADYQSELDAADTVEGRSPAAPIASEPAGPASFWTDSIITLGSPSPFRRRPND
jgi:hypothetical protein